MNIKQKNTFFLVGFALLVWLGYLFSFSKTIKVKQNFNNLTEQDELFSSISQNINQLKQQDVYYDSILETYQISTKSSFQNNLLTALNSYSKQYGMSIINFNDPHRFPTDNSGILETYLFTVKSDFITIINLIYSFEQEHKFGKIISANFEKKKNYRTSKEYLECTILIQRITQK